MKTYKPIAVFISLTFSLSAICWIYAGFTGGFPSGGGLLGLALMYAPGISAIITALVFKQSFRNFGWKPRKAKYWILAYLIPVFLLALVYMPVWLTGVADYSDLQLRERIADAVGMKGEISMGLTLLIQGTLGFITCFIPALGEEMGWRGFLVPQLATRMNFIKLGLFTALIWFLWHLPMFWFGQAEEAPALQGILFFGIKLIGTTFIINWLRIYSKSIWPAVIMHASGNLFLEGVYNDLTVSNQHTPFLLDDSGLLPALIYLAAGFLVVLWVRKNQSDIVHV